MNRTITFDIETNYLLNEEGIDYSSRPYKLNENFKIHCICAQDVNTKEEFSFVQENSKSFLSFLKNECSCIIQYNGIDFDLMVLRLYYGMEYQIQPNAHKRLHMKDPKEKFPDRLFDKHVKFIDLMILSKLFDPDRFPGHRLADWGKKLNNHKGEYGKQDNAWEKYSPEMLSYCKQDVILTTDVYWELIEEAGEHDWTEAYNLEMCIRDIVSSKSQHLGFKLNKKLAIWCVEDLQTKMKNIEHSIELFLPDRILPKNKQPKYPKTVWKQPFNTKKMFNLTGGLAKPVHKYLDILNIPDIMKQDYICSMLDKKIIDGNAILIDYIDSEIKKHSVLLNSYAISFCEKLNITDKKEAFEKIISIEIDGEVPVLSEKMTLRHKSDIKKYLVSQGWIPTNFNERDLTLNSKKKKRDSTEYMVAVEKYVEETINGPYCNFRCEFLKTTSKDLKGLLLEKKLNRSIKVRTTPKYVKNKQRDLCDGLIKMGEKFSYVKDITDWLVYDHRLNIIKSPKGTGWLNDNRLKQDGHISTPADTLGAITSRFRHRKVANVPRGTSLYGNFMRSMLTVDKNCYQIGFDADGLEVRCEAALVYKYPGGPEYVKKLVGAKPNDLHTLNSFKFGITRDEAKTLKYGLGYGAGAAKVAEQMDWDLNRATKVISEYWGEAKPSKLLIEAIKSHWELNNKLYIIGIDGRKLIARAPHILFNLALQSLGIICMKRAHIFTDRWMEDEELLGDPFKNDITFEAIAIPIIFYHDEGQQSVNEKLVRLKYFNSEDSAKEYKKEIESNGKFVLSDVQKGFEDQHLDEFCIGWSRIGELMVKGLLAAGEYYNLPVKLTSGYQIGRNWLHCH